MRWLALAILGACSFAPGSFATDAGGSGATDAPADDAAVDTTPPDAMADAFVNPAKVRRIDITDAEVAGGPHTDFPLLVSLDYTWLRSTANGGEVARDDGFDISFSADEAGATSLPFEVESYDPVAGTLVAWVRVSLEASTVLYIHYGDPADSTNQATPAVVWSAGFELVAHLNGGGDSTGKNTLTGTLTVATGQIGGARALDGSMRLDAGSNAAIDDIFTAGGVVETWFFADTLGGGGLGRLFEKGAYIVFVDDSNPFANDAVTFFHGHTGGDGEAFWHFNGITNLTGAWHHIAIVYNKDSSANDPVAFVDGVQINATRAAETAANTMLSDAAETLQIGNRGDLARGFDGTLDEIRYSSVARTGQWYLTQYRNQSSPGTFYMVSPPL